MEIKAFDEIEALEQKADKIIKNIHDAKIRYMNGDKNAGKDVLWQVYFLFNSDEYTALENKYKLE